MSRAGDWVVVMRGHWRRLTPLVLVVTGALGAATCGSGRDRPSILLFVLDTVRADAVSAYGEVAGTTPATDALAAAGLLYRRAYTQAPWTLPSHVTLFTGLLPSGHGVSMYRTIAPEGLVMLAERLHEAGYETVGLSENPWVSSDFNMTQGFERFVSVQSDPLRGKRQLEKMVDAWLRDRRTQRPFFLFVNVVDAHAPYAVRKKNRFLPAGTTAAEAARIPQTINRYLCVADRDRDLAVLRGLYLGDVAAADAKLAAVRKRLEGAGLTRDLVAIVTSDHGEHFGEHRLAQHEFSVGEALLRVPLIVHGLRGVRPAVIDEAVQLADVTPSVLRWAGLRVPEGLAGEPLPTTPQRSRSGRGIVAEYEGVDAPGVPPSNLVASMRSHRANCRSTDKVFGAMRALIRYPYKLLWFERYPAELYDLDRDPGESRDLARDQPSVVASLATDLVRRVADGPARQEARHLKPLSPEVLERLRALGYAGDGDASR